MVIGESMPQFGAEQPKNENTGSYSEEEIELIKKYTINTTPIGEDPVEAFNDSYPDEEQRVKILNHWKNLEKGGSHMTERDVVIGGDEPKFFTHSDDELYKEKLTKDSDFDE